MNNFSLECEFFCLFAAKYTSENSIRVDPATPAAVSGIFDTGDYISLIGVFVPLIGVIIMLVWQIKSFRKQLLIQSFSDYTKRYQEIILQFPEDINQEDFELSSRTDRAKVMRYMRAYYDLCSEEYFLYKEVLIKKKIWDLWREGMEFAFSKKAFEQAWDQIKTDTKYSHDFRKLVENAQSQ